MNSNSKFVFRLLEYFLLNTTNISVLFILIIQWDQSTKDQPSVVIHDVLRKIAFQKSIFQRCFWLIFIPKCGVALSVITVKACD